MGQAKRLCYDPQSAYEAARAINRARFENNWTITEMAETAGTTVDIISRVIAFGKSKPEALEYHMQARYSGFSTTTIWDLAALMVDPATGQPYEPLKYYVRCWLGLTEGEAALLSL